MSIPDPAWPDSEESASARDDQDRGGYRRISGLVYEDWPDRDLLDDFNEVAQ